MNFQGGKCMNSIRNYMRMGIIHGMAFPSSFKEEESLLESFRMIAKDSFFDVIEIGELKDLILRKKVKKIIDTSKLTVIYGGHSRLFSNGLNINDLNEEGRKRAVDILKEGIDEAYYMNASSFSFLSREYDDITKEQSLGQLVKSTKELCDYAKMKGNMNVLLEVFDYDIDKKSLLGPIELVVRFVNEMKEYSNFGIMIDLSHLPQLRETPRQAILPIKDFVKHIHIGNAVVKDKNLEAYGDQHPRFGFPNSENDIDKLVDFLDVLMEIGYLNRENPPIVSFEVKPRPYEDSEVVITNAKRILKESWEKVSKA